MTPSLLRRFAALALSSLALSLSAADPKGAKDLFTTDLSTAVVTDAKKPAVSEHWGFEKGELVAKTHETLWTKESYHNFILDLDFKVAKESNSGVFLRSMDPKNVLKALEIQVHDSTDGTKYGMVGAIYDAMPPAKSAAKPVGEWNHYTITCKDNVITVVLNGEKIIDADLNKWPEAKKNPDGTPNKFGFPLKDYTTVRGPIGFQGLHGKAMSPVWYRNIKITALD